MQSRSQGEAGKRIGKNNLYFHNFLDGDFFPNASFNIHEFLHCLDVIANKFFHRNFYFFLNLSFYFHWNFDLHNLFSEM